VVTLLHNAQLATASSLLQRDLKQVVGTLSAGVEMQAAAKRGSPHQVLQVRMEPIKTQLVALFNVSTNYEQFLAATLVPALIHILAMTAAPGPWGESCATARWASGSAPTRKSRDGSMSLAPCWAS
jgi:ABC-2 type transport system permease protein